MRTGSYRGFEVTAHDPGVALVTFDQPDRMNGMTQGMKRDLVELLTQYQLDDDVRVVVFTGTGRAFSAGDDMTGGYGRGDGAGREALVPDVGGGHRTPLGTYDALRALSQALNVAVRSLDKLTIAALNGYAIQTGLSLALACDFRVAGESARLGSATLRFGLLPDEGGHHLLLQHLGLGATVDFLFRKRIVDATEAREMGLVHEVVPDHELGDRALALARELAEGPQVSMRLLKRALYTAVESTFAHALDDIATKTAISDHHPDAAEGVRAFRERRPPRFNRWLEEDREDGEDARDSGA